jgi:L-asparaginase
VHNLIDRAGVGLEVSDQLLVMTALLERRKANLLVEFHGLRHCADPERVGSQFVESHLTFPPCDNPCALSLMKGQAVSVAADPNAKGRGVPVVLNDWIHAAHSLTKTSTTAVQTFVSPMHSLVGVSAYGKNNFYNNPPRKHTTASEFDISEVTKTPRVDIIYGDADMPPDLIDASVNYGAKGIVIAGVGNGNMNKPSLEAAARAVQKGVVVVRSSRVATGTVGRNVEINDDELGFVASDELNPQKARILLSLALLKPHTAQQIQEMFYTY